MDDGVEEGRAREPPSPCRPNTQVEATAREDAARAEATIARLRAEAAELSGGAKSRTGQLAADVARLENELRAACKRAAVRGGERRV